MIVTSLPNHYVITRRRWRRRNECQEIRLPPSPSPPPPTDKLWLRWHLSLEWTSDDVSTSLTDDRSDVTQWDIIIIENSEIRSTMDGTGLVSECSVFFFCCSIFVHLTCFICFWIIIYSVFSVRSFDSVLSCDFSCALFLFFFVFLNVYVRFFVCFLFVFSSSSSFSLSVSILLSFYKCLVTVIKKKSILK